MAEAICWSQLHFDLLLLIAARLVRVSDFIRFRSVCRRWRSAGDPNLLRTQPPLLLLPRDPTSETCTFFSLSTQQLHAVCVPAVAGHEIISAGHGWLVLLDHSTYRGLSLLNPITGASIRLPQIKDLADWNDLYKRRPILSSSPGSDDCFVIVLNVYHQRDLVAFCRPGDEEWTVMKSGEHPCDVLYHQLRFLSIHEHRGNVIACSASNPPGEPAGVPSLKAPKVWNEIRESFNLVKMEEKMFLWFWSYKLLSRYHSVRVYDSELDSRLKWSEVDSIGDAALFDSAGQSLMCSLEDFPELSKDCIYTTSPLDDSQSEDDDTKKVYVVNLKDGRYGWKSFVWKLPEAFVTEPLWLQLSLF